MDYKDFLKTKEKSTIESGFEILESEMNENLFDFQKYTVKIALKKGKFAIFADTGLGKTLMQLEIASKITEKENNPVLILSPLAVSGQTIKEGLKFGINIQKLKSDVFGKGIYITNYEQIDNINESDFCALILDESSILKNESGKYRSLLIEKFKYIKYKYAFSATPSPNDPMELGNHSEFLDVMKFNEMLAMYFVHDAGNTQKWRLKGHAVDKFYQFVSTWAIMYSHPKDIGFNAVGYDLPKLKIIERQVKTKVPEGMLFGGLAVNATDYNSSLRETEKERIAETLKIVEYIPNNEPIIIWTKQNDEAKNIYNQLVELGYKCRNVQGSDNSEKKKMTC